MPKQKTNKTALKRIKRTNPKDKKKSKLLYSESGNHHMMTKKSSRAKRRKSTHSIVYKGTAKKFKKPAGL
jgi:ribosomal protein L35